MSRRAIPFFSINGIASEVGPPITANLLYHLDASTNDNVYNDAGVTKCTNGDTVQQWNSSNNSRFAQQLTSSEKPTFRTGGQNGKSYIEFVASPNEWLYIDTWESAYESDNYTIYVVWEAVGTNSGETYPFIMSIGRAPSTALSQYFTSSSNEYEFAFTSWTGDYFDNADYADNTVQAYCHRVEAGVGQNLLVNDGEETTGTAEESPNYGSSNQRVAIACSWSGTSDARHTNMELYELLAYDSTHSDADRTLTMNYLNTKYNIWSP
jgi:hypothetical protein